MVSFKPFTHETLEDAKKVVRQVFGKGACSILDKALRNPALDEVAAPDAGEVVYSDNFPVGFNAAILRKVYLGQDYFWGIVGSTIAILPEARKDLVVFDLMKKIVQPRFGSLLFFGNSANRAGMRINKAFGMQASGPKSCGCMRVAVIRVVSFALYMLRTKLLKWKPQMEKSVIKRRFPSLLVRGFEIQRFKAFDQRLFDDFWMQYIQKNEGLVLSRSIAELKWMFGDEVASGTAVLCGALRDGALCGYVILANSGSGRCWKLVDMIAMGNDHLILDALLRGSVKILKMTTNAVYARVSGFQEDIQPVIAKTFPLLRQLDSPKFAWKFQDRNRFSLSVDVMKRPSSWFFGPYDGDECMSS